MAYDGDWIEDLVVTSPAPTESKSLGDDSIREIKRAIKNTFPNMVGDDPYTGTAADLNNAIAAIIPRGIVAPWTGDWFTYPDGPPGWTICDGRARKSGGGVAPNLKGRFIFGAVDPFATPVIWPPTQGEVGGSLETDIKLNTTGVAKSFITLNHTLTAAQSGLPAHAHTVATHAHTASGDYTGGSGNHGETPVSVATSVAGGSNASAGHAHNFTITKGAEGETLSNMPPYYCLVYLIKD